MLGRSYEVVRYAWGLGCLLSIAACGGALTSTVDDGGLDDIPKSDAARALPDGGYAFPCNSQTGLWRIVQSKFLSIESDESATAFVIDFDLRRVLASFPLQRDDASGNWAVDVDPLAVPGRPACQELPRYGVVFVTKDASGKYKDAGAPDALRTSGGMVGGVDCKFDMHVDSPSGTMVDFYAWKLGLSTLSDPIAFAPPEPGTHSIDYTVKDAKLPLCGEPDVVYMFVGRTPQRVMALNVKPLSAVNW
jgi:hypothetical protein